MLPLDDPSQFDVYSKDLACSWSQQALVDLNACVVAGFALEALANPALSCRRLSKQCWSVVEARLLMTPRIRSMFKYVNGSHANLGKQAWDVMNKLAETVSKAPTEMDAAAMANEMEPRIAEIEKMLLQPGWREPYDLSIDILESEHMTQIIQGYADEEEDYVDADDKRCVACLYSLSNVLLQLVDKVNEETANHNHFLTHMIGIPAATKGSATDDADAGDEGDEAPTNLDLIRWQLVAFEVLADCPTGKPTLIAEAKARTAIALELYEAAQCRTETLPPNPPIWGLVDGVGRPVGAAEATSYVPRGVRRWQARPFDQGVHRWNGVFWIR